MKHLFKRYATKLGTKRLESQSRAPKPVFFSIPAPSPTTLLSPSSFAMLFNAPLLGRKHRALLYMLSPTV